MTPYYADEAVTLYCGDMRQVVLGLEVEPDCIVTDPPYGETKLGWDSWPDGWPDVAALVASSMWCFGSLRMFMDRRDDFTAWKLSQDVVWEKHNGSSFANDRFKRVHEVAAHWYRGRWTDIHRDTQTTPDTTPRTVRAKRRSEHLGDNTRGSGVYISEDGGPRLMRSVLQVQVDAWPGHPPVGETRRHPRSADSLRLPAGRCGARPVRRIRLYRRCCSPVRPPRRAHRGGRAVLRGDRPTAGPGRTADRRCGVRGLCVGRPPEHWDTAVNSGGGQAVSTGVVGAVRRVEA